eukprot:m.695595 g.695595  ORF g.695595 m.695595 type:complete len:369 (+) comp22889_c0_seq8:235-1341(+)
MDNSYRLRLKGQSPQSDTQVKAKRPSPGSPRHFNKRPASGERSLSRGEAYPTGLQAASASSPPWTVAQSPQREQYSDRYIPCRMPYRSPGSSSIIASPPQQLAVVRTLDETSRIERDTSDSTSNGDTNTASTELDSDMPHNPSLGTYSQLLRNELLGDGDRLSENALAVAAAVSARTETAGTRRRGHSAVATRNGGATAAGGNSAASSPSVGARRASVLQYQGAVPHESLSPFALSPVGADSVRLLESPRRTPRKIPKVPFKVLDAPDLQDDFYLNLVDWSEQNVLCVGLGTCTVNPISVDRVSSHYSDKSRHDSVDLRFSARLRQHVCSGVGALYLSFSTMHASRCVPVECSHQPGDQALRSGHQRG